MRCVLLLLGLLATASALRAQVIAGVLMEGGSRAPLPGGLVTLLDRDSVPLAQLRTDSAGAFLLTVPRGGTYRLHAGQAGYRPATSPPLTLGAQDTLAVEFSLARDAVVLEPLVVTARSRRLTPAARRFYDRVRTNPFGTYLTRDLIEKAHPRSTTELFNRIPGVSTTRITGGGNSVVVRGTCRPTVFVDGVRIDEYRSIDDLAQPLELEGVEVYRHAADAPAEYAGVRAGCAVVLIWTRIE